MERNAQRRLGGGRRRDLRLRQPGGRGQPQRRAHGARCSPGCRSRPRRDRQPPLRLGHGRGRHRGARDQGRRGRADDRRRRREHDARAVRAWARRESAFSRTAEIYDTTIGWRFVNPTMKDAVRRRFDAGDGRERRRRSTRSRARTRMPSRCARQQRAARGAGRAAGSREEIVAGRDPAAQGRADGRRQRRASARRHHARGAGQAEGAVPRGRHA